MTSKTTNLDTISSSNSSSNMPDLNYLSNTMRETFLGVSDELLKVEKRIEDCLGSEAVQLTEISHYLQNLGGKRVRPLLTVLVAKLFGAKTTNQQLIDTAAGIELIHMATLLHDDIIDRSSTRRGKPSAFHTYGLTPTLLTGDFLLVRAFGLCSTLPRFIIESTEAACVSLTEGELLEGKLSTDRKLNLSEYENIVDKKTASLFSLGAKSGAYLAEVKPEYISAMERFGSAAGIAFQMIDDILDVVADEDLLGKPAGADLRQHTPSLLNILWIESGDAFAKEYFSSEDTSEEDCRRAMDKIVASGIIEDARKIAKSRANEAITAINSIPCSELHLETKEQLEALVEYTLTRCL